MLERRRMMMGVGAGRPYQQIQQVRISTPSVNQEPIALLKITNFNLDKDTFILEPNIYYGNGCGAVIQFGVSANVLSGPRLGTYYWRSQSGNGTRMAVMLAFNHDNVSSSVWKNEFYGYADPITPSCMINGASNPTMSGLNSNGFVGGSSSSYNTWKSTYNQSEIGYVYFKRGKETNTSCPFFRGLTIRNGNTLIADIIPVMFLDTHTYGVYDKISGNYADDNSFDINVTFIAV